MGGAMADADNDETVKARPRDRTTINAASALVGAIEEKENKTELVVPLGSFVATANSHKHLPAKDLGATSKADKDGKPQVDIRAGTAAHFLLEGTRTNRARKRKSMTGAIAMEKDADAVLTIQNGLLDADATNDPVESVFPAKHFTEEGVESFKKRLRRDIDQGTVSSVSEYKAELLDKGAP